MGLFDNVVIDFPAKARARPVRPGRRAYAAAQMGRLTADWLSASASIDRDIRMGMIPVRSRARDLSQNNEFARAYLRAVRKNIVGSDGFGLQVKAVSFESGVKTPDRVANDMIERHFAKWSKPQTATVTGKMSFRKLQEVIVETCARDGEMFVRMVRGTQFNPYAFALQPVEPDYVDHNLNKDLGNGRMVRMGVELDAWRRPVAYHVSVRNAALELYGSASPAGPHVRVPASEMIHVFDPERADQTRGISWMAPAMIALHNLKGYVEAAIINARAGANKLGFFRDPQPSGPVKPYVGDAVDASGQAIATCEPGTFEDIGTKEFVGFDPRYPDQQFDPFVKSILRGISAGLGVSFASISNDLTDVNFSSIRTGLLDERETWKSLQSWFAEMFLNRVFAEWLFMALATGAVPLPDRKYDKFNQPKWVGRRWSWVKPLEETNAAIAAVKAGLKTRTQVIAEDGGDIEERWEELAEEAKLAEALGLKFDDGDDDDGSLPGARAFDQESSEEEDGDSPGSGAASGRAADEDDQH
jgi:lambda family phage portal protein